jgi:hypothetical protein
MNDFIGRILKNSFPIFLVATLFSGCVNHKPKTVVLESADMLPETLDFYITPKKNYFRPYDKVKLNLKPKGDGTFQNTLRIKSSQMSRIHLTPLSQVNGEYTYHVDWRNIHNNHHGGSGKTTRITWYLQNNWNGILPQSPGNYTIEFNISSPLGYWHTKTVPIKIHIPTEDVIPYNELVSGDCYLFFEYEYSARMYNTNRTSYDLCPPIRLPYEQMKDFVKKYPYTYFIKMLKTKLKRTKRILVNDYTQYDIEDIIQVEELLKIIE